MTRKKILVSVVGPTAAGKTRFAVELAKYFQTEIISADSRQFYREMEIGTAKPCRQDLEAVPHHFINSRGIKEYYSAGMFEREAIALLEKLFDRHRVVLATGGSGLFLKALWEGFDDMPKVSGHIRDELKQTLQDEGIGKLLAELERADPAYYQKVDRQNHQRVLRALEVIRASGGAYSTLRKGHQTTKRPFANIKIGLDMERSALFSRIDRRMDSMIENGLFEEARSLVRYRDHVAMKTVGYSEIFNYLDGEYGREEAIRLLKRNSRRYAKRQISWFKKDNEIKWHGPDQLPEAVRLIESKLNI